MMNKDKVIIFDFDGTLADTMLLGWEISNRLSHKFGYREVKREELADFRGKSTQDVIKGVGISLIKLPLVAQQFKKELNKEILNLKLFNDIDVMIKTLYETKYILGILTSNSRGNVNKFLENHDLEEFFEFVHSGNNIFGKHTSIRNILKKHNLRDKEVILVGDETRDIEAARKCKLKIISVTWGFHLKEILEKYQPDFLVDEPLDIIKVLED
ncbi:HAD-IA family hydrolase [Fulvivirgaceae bacterium BMA10]|uniref:HAD-IA family hydrolase n=1 Tax=Splendidivirga corallicola TaxID=3051826 RepID=A0ABT8KX84_9BACT|nr:HAD-IA family hydrolase [Fulvivirgaceae bacterium BMA10]